MKNFLAVILLISLISINFAQERWNIDRRTLPKPPIGNYTVLPDNSNSWVNEIHSSRVYQTPQGTMVVGPNVRVLPNTHQQDEIILVKSPVNPLIMFGSANTTVGTSYGQGAYITTDGGATWSGTDLVPGGLSVPSDPGPAIDKVT
jgi:hypothetical protein